MCSFEVWELIFNAFKSGTFSIKETQGKGRPSNVVTRLKILSPKKMLQRLSIALSQVKAGNTSENLLNKSEKHIFYVASKRNYLKSI